MFLRRTYDPQDCQSAGASRQGHCNGIARALVTAARALVLVSFIVLLVPCVFAWNLSLTRKQAAASSCCHCRELKHTTTAAESMRCSRPLAINGVLSLQLPLYAVIPCPRLETRNTRIPREYDVMYGRCELARTLPSALGSKPQFHPALGLYRTGVSGTGHFRLKYIA